MLRRSLTLFGTFCLFASLTSAQRINFEVLPGAGSVRPSDGQSVDDQWRNSPHYVRFMLEGPGTPTVPQIAWGGGVATAFDGPLPL